MSQAHDFKKSLAAGHKGEELLMRMIPDMTRTDGFRNDFVLSDGTKLELKTDSYDMADTPNMFIELYSDLDHAKVGGPAQALTHGSTKWAYLYSKNETVYIFNTLELLERVETLVKTGLYPIKRIPNKTWVTTGVAIPRAVLVDLAQEIILKKD